MKTWVKPIKEMGACAEGLVFAERYDSLTEAWASCEHGDWMLWLLGKLSGEPGSDSRRKLVLTACKCARLSLQYVQTGETRPLKAIETTEQWANKVNGITLSDVQKSAYAAHAATYAAYAAAYAAAAAADAAYAAYAAAYAVYAANTAVYAVYAANAAAYAAYAANAAARIDILKKCADIVREIYPVAPTLKEAAR